MLIRPVNIVLRPCRSRACVPERDWRGGPWRVRSGLGRAATSQGICGLMSRGTWDRHGSSTVHQTGLRSPDPRVARSAANIAKLLLAPISSVSRFPSPEAPPSASPQIYRSRLRKEQGIMPCKPVEPLHIVRRSITRFSQVVRLLLQDRRFSRDEIIRYNRPTGSNASHSPDPTCCRWSKQVSRL